MALSSACKQEIWTSRLLESFGIFISPFLLCDNQAPTKISKNPVLHQRTKYINTQIHFVREKISEGKVDIEYVIIYLFIQVYCPYATLGYERPTPHL
jgi:hypothetical protein